MVYVDKATRFTGVKSYVSAGFVATVAEVFAVIAICKGQ
jgi:hypothetical protein